MIDVLFILAGCLIGFVLTVAALPIIDAFFAFLFHRRLRKLRGDEIENNGVHKPEDDEC